MHLALNLFTPVCVARDGAGKSVHGFTPSPEVPALQFFDSVTPGGAAEKAGLLAGDYLLEVTSW